MKQEEKNEMHALNNSVLNGFSVEELEQRLETDPLAVGQLLDISSSVEGEDDGCCFMTSCRSRE